MAMRGADLLRVKGLLNVEGCAGPVVVQFVQHLAHPPVELAAWPDDNRQSRVVFITRGISGEPSARIVRGRATRSYKSTAAANRDTLSRAAAIMSGTAASLPGAMMWQPATCGISASSATMSRQMRRPSAAGSPRRLHARR